MSPVEGSDAWKAQDKGPTIVAVCWSVTAISTLFVAGRLYVRGKIFGKLHSDDYFTLAGLICGYISTALSTLAVSYGNGRHFSLLTTNQQENAILWTIAGFCPGVMSFGLPKLAVVSLLTRLLNPGPYHKWFLWGIGIWCQLTLFATVGVLLGKCTPARSQWDFSVEGHCFPSSVLVGYCIYAGSYSAFVDVYLAIYPTVVLVKLQLGFKKKMALCVALGIGSISAIVAIYKTTRIPSLASSDFSYDTSDLVMWTVIEGSTIIIASSIPVLQPLLEIILRRNPLSSNNKSKPTPLYYEDYSERSKHGTGIELGKRKPKSKAKDDLGLTIMDGEGSQEDILKPEEKGGGNAIVVKSVAGSEGSNGSEGGTGGPFSGAGIATTSSVPVKRNSRPSLNEHHQQGKIMRTDDITVSYDMPHQPGSPRNDTTGSQRWRAI